MGLRSCLFDEEGPSLLMVFLTANHEEKGRTMAERYNQLSLKERMEIEEGLGRGDSFRTIALLLGRNVSTISREVRQNRIVRSYNPKKSACRDRNWCKRVEVCDTCVRPGAHCVGCDVLDCRDVCPAYAKQIACDVLVAAPWVCNACRRHRFGCNHSIRYVYNAQAAHKNASERRSISRQGIDMDPDKASFALSLVKDGLSRGLSPYEISVLYEDVIGVHRSTIYRWVEAGYGGLTNLELERKVGFRKRKKTTRRSTSHSPKRAYGRFLELSADERASATEMDTVCGRAGGEKCALTLIFPPTSLQLWLLTTHDMEGTASALALFRDACPKPLFDRLMHLVVTDNGEEFSDEDRIADIIGEDLAKGVSLYYCDPRHSEQKPHCEKNHSEGRQIVVKGMFDFDEFQTEDMRVVMCHMNSNPRLSLGGLSPIEAFKLIYGEQGSELLDAFGIEQMGPDELMLVPEALDEDRKRRGEAPLTRLK